MCIMMYVCICIYYCEETHRIELPGYETNDLRAL